MVLQEGDRPREDEEEKEEEQLKGKSWQKIGEKNTERMLGLREESHCNRQGSEYEYLSGRRDLDREQTKIFHN